ncbi:uncharacterized protein METZ01_LOCUS261638 [marine metagenome]|uniref:Uncharacterized protein n=1 Tax=marine metagenome TaxID=408172 RepID=A0A382J9A9_9ZZZZ
MISSGISFAQGTHQVAKKLTTRFFSPSNSLERKYLLLSSLNKDMGGASSPTFMVSSAEKQNEIVSIETNIYFIRYSFTS